MIEYLKFKEIIDKGIEFLPDQWRRGQKVFNFINSVYDVARDVQFKDNVDCFYNDNEIDNFITVAWTRVAGTMKERPTIKVDVDGVLRDVVSEMCALYNERTGETINPEDVTEYDCRNVFTKIENPRQFFFYDNAERIFGSSKMFDGAKEAIDKMRACGIRVVLATYQDTVEAKKITVDWLDKHGIKYDSILFSNSVDKSDVTANFVVDDCPEILEKERKDGVIRFCVDHPYNRSVDNGEIRVVSLTDITEHYFYLVNDAKKNNNKEEKDRE